MSQFELTSLTSYGLWFCLYSQLLLPFACVGLSLRSGARETNKHASKDTSWLGFPALCDRCMLLLRVLIGQLGQWVLSLVWYDNFGFGKIWLSLGKKTRSVFASFLQPRTFLSIISPILTFVNADGFLPINALCVQSVYGDHWIKTIYNKIYPFISPA